ncbi:unnamed protein product, partial [Mesorhabditis spiculigera]
MRLLISLLLSLHPSLFPILGIFILRTLVVHSETIDAMLGKSQPEPALYRQQHDVVQDAGVTFAGLANFGEHSH